MVIILVDVGFVLVNLAYAVFAALRMFALYDMSKPIFALVLAVGLMNPCTQIFLIHMATIGATGGFQPAGNPAFLLMGRFNCYHLAKKSGSVPCFGTPGASGVHYSRTSYPRTCFRNIAHRAYMEEDENPV